MSVRMSDRKFDIKSDRKFDMKADRKSDRKSDIASVRMSKKDVSQEVRNCFSEKIVSYYLFWAVDLWANRRRHRPPRRRKPFSLTPGGHPRSNSS